jgi:hypothetical protein
MRTANKVLDALSIFLKNTKPSKAAALYSQRTQRDSE